MNKTFNINRFGKVLTNDLNKAWQNYGYSFIILILVPAIVCFFYTFFPLIFGGEIDHIRPAGRIAAFLFAALALFVSFPTKVYGDITEKKYGTNFLMLPASTFEKFLSMIVVCGIVAPLAFGIGFWAVDSILDLTGAFQGGNLLTVIANTGITNNEYVSVNIYSLIFFSAALNMLIFLLGAIYFKKSKAAKTILCLMGLSIALSMLAGAIGSWIFDSEAFLQFDDENVARWLSEHADKAGLYLNLLVDGFRTIWFLIVGALIYLRVKTLKH